MSRDNGDFTDGDEDGEVDYDYNIWEALDAMAQAGRLSRRDCIAMYVNPSCHTLYTPLYTPCKHLYYHMYTCVHPLYMYTHHIHTKTSKHPTNTL